MTDSEEKEARDSQDPRTINIEIPAGCFEGMFRMMAGGGNSGKGISGCCDMTQEICCPQSDDEGEREIRIVIKRKKQ